MHLEFIPMPLSQNGLSSMTAHGIIRFRIGHASHFESEWSLLTRTEQPDRSQKPDGGAAVPCFHEVVSAGWVDELGT